MQLFLDEGLVHAVRKYIGRETETFCGWWYSSTIEGEDFTVVTCLSCLSELQTTEQAVDVSD